MNLDGDPVVVVTSDGPSTEADSDKDAILPAVNKANQLKIPVIAYDRLFESPEVFYISFNNKEVGRLQAQAIYAELGGKPLSIHPGSGGGTDAGFANRSGKAVVLESLISQFLYSKAADGAGTKQAD